MRCRGRGSAMTQIAAKARQDRPAAGIALMLAAFMLFSFIDAGAKWLAVLSLPAIQLAFMRYLPHFVISTALIVSGGRELDRFASPHMPLLVLRAMLLMVSTVLNFVALGFLPLSLTATLLFSSPIIICLLSWPLLGERVGPWRSMAICVGFIGVAVAIRPFDSQFHWAAFLSIGAAFGFALYTILTRRLAGQVATDVMQFYTGAVGTIGLLPFALWRWQSPEAGIDWAVMMSLGVFGWAGHQLLTGAHRFAPASTLTPYGYSFILYLVAWSYVLFDDLPGVWTMTGAFIIVCSGLFIWFRELRLGKTGAHP